MEPETAVDPANKNTLCDDITKFIAFSRKRHNTNDRTSRVIITLGIILGLAVTAAGFFGYGTLAGILGLFISLFIALQNAFYFAERAEFYRIVYTEGDNLLDLLRLKVRYEKEFQAVLDAFMTLKKHAATNLPKGKGMEVVKEMYGSAPKEILSKSAAQ